MSTAPIVSVVIPTYNRAQFLPSSIESVLEQSYPHIEILVIDDGSTDDTRKVLEPLQDKIRYLTSDHQGAAHARNIGMKAASGKYIAFLDSDDTYLPYKLELQVAFMGQHPEVGMVCTEFSGAYESECKDPSHLIIPPWSVSSTFLRDEKGRYIEEFHMRTYHNIWKRTGWEYEEVFASEQGRFACGILDQPIPYYIGDIFNYVLMETLIPSNTILFPKSLLQTVGYQDITIPSGQDYEFVVRICKYCQVAFLNIPTYVILHHGNQLSNLHQYTGREKLFMRTYEEKFYLSVVTRWAYNDKEYYQKNRELVNFRLGELYCRLGGKWLEYGDVKQAKECLQKCKEFGYTHSNNYRLYWLLSSAPSFLSRSLLKFIRQFKELVGRLLGQLKIKGHWDRFKSARAARRRKMADHSREG